MTQPLRQRCLLASTLALIVLLLSACGTNRGHSYHPYGPTGISPWERYPGYYHSPIYVVPDDDPSDWATHLPAEPDFPDEVGLPDLY